MYVCLRGSCSRCGKCIIEALSHVLHRTSYFVLERGSVFVTMYRYYVTQWRLINVNSETAAALYCSLQIEEHDITFHDKSPKGRRTCYVRVIKMFLVALNV